MKVTGRILGIACLFSSIAIAQTTSGTAPYHNYGTGYTYMRISIGTCPSTGCTTYGIGHALFTANTVMPAIPVLSGSAKLNLIFTDSSFTELKNPSSGSLTVAYFVDNQLLGESTADSNGNLYLTIDTTAAPFSDGTHVINVRVVSGTAASPYAVDQLRSGGQSVVVRNHGANTGSQTVAVTGFDIRSIHDPSTPDFIPYPGQQITNTVHPYSENACGLRAIREHQLLERLVGQRTP